MVLAAVLACGDEAVAPPPAPTIWVEPRTVNFNAVSLQESLIATVLAGEGDVVWTTSDTAVATLSDGHMTSDLPLRSVASVYSAGNGSAVITASYSGVSATVAVTVNQEFRGLAIGPQGDPYSFYALGDTLRLYAVALDPEGQAIRGFGGALAWSSDDRSVATVDARGLLTATGNGRATITVASGAFAGSKEVIVSAGRLIATPSEHTFLALGDTVRLTAEMVDANGNSVDPEGRRFFQSLDESVALADSTGLVTAVGNGVTVVRAEVQTKCGTTRCTVLIGSADLSVTVSQRAVRMDGVSPSQTLRALGDTLRLEARAVDANGHQVADTLLGWSSSNETVAMVDGTGLVTAVANGRTVVTAASGGVSSASSVTVAQQATTVRVTPAADTLRARGETLRLEAGLVDANGHPVAGGDRTFAWSSSNETVVAVDGTGAVTAVREGTAEITARSASAGLEGATRLLVNFVTEREVLTALYDATGGRGWQDARNWLTGAPLGSWHGVETDERGRVVGLALRENQLRGALPSEIGYLPHLERLDLRYNALSGPIPRRIGNLESLRALNLSSNGITGPIPPELGELERLESLTINRTRVEGPIPRELGDLRNLGSLSLADNRLTGPIPPELGGFAHLAYLNLGDNRLSGPIPPELGDLRQLQELFLRDNQLTGPIPLELTQLENLTELSLSANQLTGRIPAEFGRLQQLRILTLDQNELTGRIPPELGNLLELWILHLRFNHLTGSIPPELGNLRRLGVLDLQDNRLTGSIPPELGNPPNVRALLLAHNPITGPIPPELGKLSNLEDLWIWNMGLTGPIPPELGNLTNLRGLSLQRNNLTGPIPPELGNLSEVRQLYLHQNERLTGGIPPEFGNLDSLRYLGVHATGLSGRLPQTLLNLSLVHFSWAETGLCSPGDAEFQAWLNSIPYERTIPGPRAGEICREDALIRLYETAGGSGWRNAANWLTDAPVSSWHGVTVDAAGDITAVDLRGNGLAGTIPAEMGVLADLERLDLRDNRLTGAVPAELGDLERLRELYLSDNRLEGRLPAELGALGELRALHLARNRFEGALPSSLARLSRLADLQWEGSGLCAPAARWFQSWLGGVDTQTGGATCGSALRLAVPTAHVVQAVQDLPGNVPLVAGREGLLRVFATADQANEHRPRARATFFAGGREIHRVDMQLESEQGIPEEVDQGRLERSFRATIPGHVLTAGVEMAVEIDPEGSVPRSAGSVTRLRQRLDVRGVPHMELTVVPVLEAPDPDSAVLDWVEGMGPGHPAMDFVTTVLPVGGYTVRVREPYVFSIVLSDLDAWYRLDREMDVLRHLEGIRGFVYGAAIQRTAIGGVGGGSVAVGVTRPDVMAHELGHVMGLWHAPCGLFFSPPDPDFPYSDGSIGRWGYDARGDSLVAPTTPDVMSYCRPPWISDYYFTQALEYRIETWDVPPAAASAERSPTLLLWGGRSPEGGLQLEPAFVVDASAHLPAGGGPYRLEGYDARGALAFSLDFAMVELDGGGGNFLFAIPFEEAWHDSLQQVVLTGPEGMAVLNEDGREPVALVLDRETGGLRSVLRGQDAAAAATATAADRAGPGRTVPDTRTLVSFGLPSRPPPN